jgi:transposase
MRHVATGKKAKRARRSFTDEFKAGAVRLVLDEGKTASQVARDLDLTASALGHWVERARADRSGGKTGLTTEERAELSKLRKGTCDPDNLGQCAFPGIRVARPQAGCPSATERILGESVRILLNPRP